MVDFEYDSLLDRARARIPKNISERSRWTMPEPEILIEGNQTILRNFAAIVDAMDRDANHVYQFLINELGTSGTREQVRVLFKGRVPPKRIKEKIVSGILITMLSKLNYVKTDGDWGTLDLMKSVYSIYWKEADGRFWWG